MWPVTATCRAIAVQPAFFMGFFALRGLPEYGDPAPRLVDLLPRLAPRLATDQHCETGSRDA
jgi:hypothetical protein